MPEPVVPHGAAKRKQRLGLRGLVAMVAPRRFSDSLAQADHAASLSHNVALRESAPDKQLEHLNATHRAVVDRLVLLRRALLGSFTLMASAIAVALAFRAFYTGPMLPRGVFAVGAVFCFATATLARLGWRGETTKGGTSVDRLDQRIFHLLYWIGMCWTALAVF